MKKKFVKWCIYTTIITVLLLIFPVFFNKNSDITFFWNILSILAISFNIFFIIIEKKEKKMKHFEISLLFLLSIIMANKLYSYNVIITILPFLEKIPKDIMFGIGISLMLISTFSGAFYKIYNYYYQKDLTGKEFDNTYNSTITDTTVTQTSHHDTPPQNSPARENQTNQNIDTSEQITPKFLHFFSILVMLFLVIIASIFIMHILQKNEGFWLELTNSKKLPELALNFSTGIGILIAFIFVMLIMLFYFTQMCFSIILGIFKKQKLSFQDDSFLKCISLFLTLFCFFAYRNSTVKDLFNLLNGSNKVASLLIVIVTFTIITFITLIIYKILQSFTHQNGLLRSYTDRIFHLTIDTVGKMLINILETASKIPDLLEPLLDATKKSFIEIKDILFDDND